MIRSGLSQLPPRRRSASSIGTRLAVDLAAVAVVVAPSLAGVRCLVLVFLASSERRVDHRAVLREQRQAQAAVVNTIGLGLATAGCHVAVLRDALRILEPVVQAAPG